MKCIKICEKYKVKKPGSRIPRYESGQKYCSHCAVFMEIDEIRCPCCRYQLKTKPTKKRNENNIKRL